MSSRLLLFGTGVVVFASVAALFFSAPSEGRVLLAPGWDHVLGTDRFGRDVLVITVQGALFTIGGCALALLLAVGVGVAVGIVSALYLGGSVDRFLVLWADALRSFPSIVLALLFVVAGIPIWLLLVVYFWVPIWRVMRVSMAAQRTQPYVLAARLFGLSRFRSLAQEALPNILPGLRPYVVLVFAEMVSVQAGLEFLGFGPSLDQPSFGTIVADALRVGGTYAWVWIPSVVLMVGVFLLLLTLSLSLSKNAPLLYVE